MTSRWTEAGLQSSALPPSMSPMPWARRWSWNLGFEPARSLNQSSQNCSSRQLMHPFRISRAHSARWAQASEVMLQASRCRTQLLMHLRASLTRSRLLKVIILRKETTGAEGLKRTSSSSSSALNLRAGFTNSSSPVDSSLMGWPSSLITSFHIKAFCFFFSSRLSRLTSLNSRLTSLMTGPAAAKVCVSGVRQFLMTGSRGGMSAASGERARQKRVWQKYWRVGLKVFSTRTSSSSSSPSRRQSIIRSTSPRTTSRCPSLAFFSGLKGQSRTSSTVGSSMRQNISRSAVLCGMRTTSRGETPFLRLRETQRAMAYLLSDSIEQTNAVKILRPASPSAGTTRSTSLMRQWRGILFLSTNPRKRRFFSSKTLLPASRMLDIGTSCGPQLKALMTSSLATRLPASSPCITQLCSRMTSRSPMAGLNSAEASYLPSDFNFYLRTALQVLTYTCRPGAISITPLYFATGLVSRLRKRRQSSMASEAGKIWAWLGASSRRRTSSQALRSCALSMNISPSSSLRSALQLVMKSMGTRFSLTSAASSLPARVRTSWASKSVSPMPLVKRKMRLLYFFLPQWSLICPSAKLTALKMSPPGLGESKRASPSCCTFRTRSRRGFSRACRRRLFPSSLSLSPKRMSPSSWVALLNSFCWRVSLQHSRAIFARLQPSENSSSMALPTSTTSRIAYFDILIIIHQSHLNFITTFRSFPTAAAKKQTVPFGACVGCDIKVMSEEEVAAVAGALVRWAKLEGVEQECGARVEEMDISITCQYSGSQVVHPARSERCDISCCVEKAVLEETLVCSCGREIDEQNYYVQDWELQTIVGFIREHFGGKVKMIRLDLVNKRFWPL